MRVVASPIIAAAVMALASVATPARAQELVPIDPGEMSRSFTVNLSEQELPWDDFASDSPAYTTERYSSNLNHTWTLVANPYFGSARFDFGLFSLNPIDDFGLDHVELGWRSFTPTHTLTGHHTGDSFTVPWTEPRDLQDPGMDIRFRSFGNAPMEVTPTADGWVETEGDGFLIRRITVEPHSNDVDPNLESPFEIGHTDNILGLLLAGGDVIQFRIADPGEKGTAIALWLVGDKDTDEVGLLGRCGRRPTQSDSDLSDATRSSSFPSTPDGNSGPAGAWIETPSKEACPEYFFAVRNRSSVDRAFRLTARKMHQIRTEPLRVGIAWEATETQVAAIIDTIRRATTAFYGATEGGTIIRDIFIYNNASNCDNGVGVDNHACFGIEKACHVCWSETMGGNAVTRTLTDGFISINDPDGPGPQVNDNWRMVLHEFGHSFHILRDEYEKVTTTDCGEITLRNCGASLMSGSVVSIWWNTYSFCTKLNHRTALRDMRNETGVPGSWRVTNGPDTWDCDGDKHWTNVGPNHQSMGFWPDSLSASNQIYMDFLGRADAMGRITRVPP